MIFTKLGKNRLKNRSGNAKGDYRFQRFDKFWSTLHSVLLTFGLIVGGAWALVRFDRLLEVKLAEAQLDKLKAEIKSATRTAEESRILKLDLLARQISRGKSSQRWIVVELHMKNLGNSDIQVSFDKRLPENRFYVAKVFSGNNGALKFSDQRHLAFVYADGIFDETIIRPGAENDIYRTAVQIEMAGLYLVRFSAPAWSKADSGIRREVAAQTYVYVQ